MLQMYSEGCEYVNIAWALGSKVLPYSNSSRSMALDNLLSPNSTLYSEENKKKNRWRNGSKVMSKSMIKHLCRHNKKANCGLLPCMKKKKNQTNRCWNPDNTNTLVSLMATWKMKPLKNKKNKWNVDMFLFKSLSEVVSCVCLLSTISKLALVN